MKNFIKKHGIKQTTATNVMLVVISIVLFSYLASIYLLKETEAQGIFFIIIPSVVAFSAAFLYGNNQSFGYGDNYFNVGGATCVYIVVYFASFAISFAITHTLTNFYGVIISVILAYIHSYLTFREGFDELYMNNDDLRLLRR